MVRDLEISKVDFENTYLKGNMEMPINSKPILSESIS